MKNYIANSGKGWITSTDYIAEQLNAAIALGRKQHDEPARKEALIHLGAALHTFEDFAAHSNFVELCLIKQGVDSVFPLVGDKARVVASDIGRSVAPLVTGTSGVLDVFQVFLGDPADDETASMDGQVYANPGELELLLQVRNTGHLLGNAPLTQDRSSLLVTHLSKTCTRSFKLPLTH